MYLIAFFLALVQLGTPRLCHEPGTDPIIQGHLAGGTALRVMESHNGLGWKGL